jgi:hypothetical protein
LQVTILWPEATWTANLTFICAFIPIKAFGHFLGFFGGNFQIIAA